MATYAMAVSVETDEQLKVLKDIGLAEESVTLESLKETEGWIGGTLDKLQWFWFTMSDRILNAGLALMIQKKED